MTISEKVTESSKNTKFTLFREGLATVGVVTNSKNKALVNDSIP
jgi:hypothetical protein